MRPDLEQYLWDRINGHERPFDMARIPKYVIADMLAQGMIQSPKQAWRTLEKWLGKGIYDYGVAIDCGWRTREILRPEPPKKCEKCGSTDNVSVGPGPFEEALGILEYET